MIRNIIQETLAFAGFLAFMGALIFAYIATP
jgi:hypothetical protein